jgi:D-alanyl-D-alanine carboxypeptidase
MGKTIKKAQTGISTMSERGRIGKNKMVGVGTAKVDRGNYKVKTKTVSKAGDNAVTSTTKTSRTLKGVLSGKPSPKKLGIDKKKTASQSFSTSNLYKKGGKISKKKK